MLMQLIYMSRAVRPFRPEELRELLADARNRNTAAGVTGMLLYDEGAFLQVLEGPKAGVEAVFASIERDPRHGFIRTLEREPIEARGFAHWAMAFVDVHESEGPREPAGWQELASGSDAGSRARRYLQLFHGELYRELIERPTQGAE